MCIPVVQPKLGLPQARKFHVLKYSRGRLENCVMGIPYTFASRVPLAEF
jgi:hypothetical protein